MALLTHKTTLLLSEDEYRLLSQKAVATRKTMGELIRLAINKMYRFSSKRGKKGGWEKLFKSNAPVSDWKTMEKEITRGRLS